LRRCFRKKIKGLATNSNTARVLNEYMLDQKIRMLVDNLGKGDKTSLARLISLVERESPEVPEIMELVSPSLNKGYKIGITGLAGAGKSTLIDQLTTQYRKNGNSVGIIAIDPSSQFSGGAVLGDRIRMQRHYLDDGVFIRSMATRGSHGGLNKTVADAVKLMNASGKDIIFIETTGVGQTETDIINIADIVVMVLVPGFGDSIQLMKAGLVEISDIIVVNKADREGADILESEIRDELEYSPKKETVVLQLQAANDIGIEELYKEIEKRRNSKLVFNNSPSGKG
jgi:LAO/AO transport system kinase